MAKFDETKPVVWTPEDASRFLTSAIHEAQKPLAEALKQRPITSRALALLIGVIVVAALAIALILSSQLEKTEKRADSALQAREEMMTEKVLLQAQSKSLEDRLDTIQKRHDELNDQMSELKTNEERHRRTIGELARFKQHNDLLRDHITGLEKEKAALSSKLMQALSLEPGVEADMESVLAETAADELPPETPDEPIEPDESTEPAETVAPDIQSSPNQIGGAIAPPVVSEPEPPAEIPAPAAPEEPAEPAPEEEPLPPPAPSEPEAADSQPEAAATDAQDIPEAIQTEAEQDGEQTAGEEPDALEAAEESVLTDIDLIAEPDEPAEASTEAVNEEPADETEAVSQPGEYTAGGTQSPEEAVDTESIETVGSVEAADETFLENVEGDAAAEAEVFVEEALGEEPVAPESEAAATEQ